MIFAKNFVRNFEKKNTWNIRCLVVESFVPATQRTSVFYWMLSDFKKAQGISLKIQNWVNSPNEKWRELSFGFQLENRNSISLHQFNGDLLAIVGHHGYTEDQFIQKVTKSLFKLAYSGHLWCSYAHPWEVE